MNDADLLCPDCEAPYEVADNYCRECGMYLAVQRAMTPVVPEQRAIEPVRASLPAPVKKAAAAVAVGAALQIAVGVTGRYLARQAARQAVGVIKGAPRPRAKRRAIQEAPARPVAVSEPADGATAVSETLIIQRVWMRRR